MIKVSLIDVERIFRDFYNLTHFKIVLFDSERNIVTSYPKTMCRFCSAVRKNKELAHKCKLCDEYGFTSEENLLDGTVDGCLPTLNFGSKVEKNFASHDKLFPNVPKMCMEMWDGWFDAWGDECHHTTSAVHLLAEARLLRY